MESYFTDQISSKLEFLDTLKKAKNIIICSHQNPDGDAFGSSLGLLGFLKNHITAAITFVSPTDYASYLAWMPGTDSIKIYDAGLDLLIEEADLIFCLDFSSKSRLKDMQHAVLKANCPKVIIDHHEQPEDFGSYYYWDQKASSTCELIYRFIEDLQLSHHIDLNVATCLYTGLVTDTGSFRFNATSAKVLRIAADLLEKGVNPSEIHRNLFDQNNINRLKILGRVFNNNMVHLPQYRTVYFFLSEQDLAEFQSSNGDTEGIVNFGLSVENTVMAAIFIEKDGIIKISFRSIHDFSVADLSRDHFSGGGHKNAAGGRSENSLQETIEKFLTLLPNYESNLLIQPK